MKMNSQASLSLVMDVFFSSHFFFFRPLSLSVVILRSAISSGCCLFCENDTIACLFRHHLGESKNELYFTREN